MPAQEVSHDPVACGVKHTGDVEGRFATPVPGIDVRTRIDQKLNDDSVARLSSFVQWCIAIFSVARRIAALQAQKVRPAKQWSIAIFSVARRIGVRAGLQRAPNSFHVSPSRRLMQRYACLCLRGRRPRHLIADPALGR
ncbi:MAG: hypothetical protein U9R79_22735 [Armatimonadota bacterium]|nr:hypothetical protein [Armatimonadota bacterium]